MSALEQEIRTPQWPAGEGPDSGLDDVARRGLAFYEAHLRRRLEPVRNGQAVAIHVDTGDYALAATSGDARPAPPPP